MAWFFISAILFLIFVIGLGVALSKTAVSSSRVTGGVTAGTVLLIWIIYTCVVSFHEVAYNHVLVVTQFGQITGRTGSGLVTTAPWQDTTEESTRTQRQNYTLYDVPSIENQSLTANLAITYHVDAPKVTELFNQYGADWYGNLVDPFITRTVHQVTGQYQAVFSHSHPGVVSDAIQVALQNFLSSKKNGTDVSIDAVNATFQLPPALQASIVQKQVAVQKADTEKQLVNVAKYQGRQKFEEALGEANANRALERSINPTLIQYLTVQKLQKGLTTCIIPQGTTVLNPCSVTGK